MVPNGGSCRCCLVVIFLDSQSTNASVERYNSLSALFLDHALLQITLFFRSRSSSDHAFRQMTLFTRCAFLFVYDAGLGNLDPEQIN